jgi:hypothetical protein
VALRPVLTDGLPLAPTALARYLSATHGQPLPLTGIWTLVLRTLLLRWVLLRVMIADEPTRAIAPRAVHLVRLAAKAGNHGPGSPARCAV